MKLCTILVLILLTNFNFYHVGFQTQFKKRENIYFEVNMKYQFNTPLLLTSCFLFILVNNKSIAAPDAGSLLKQEEEIYKYYKDPLLKPKKKPKNKNRIISSSYI